MLNGLGPEPHSEVPAKESCLRFVLLFVLKGMERAQPRDKGVIVDIPTLLLNLGDHPLEILARIDFAEQCSSQNSVVDRPYFCRVV